VYWTAELKKQDAVVEFPYRPRLVQQAGRYFDSVVQNIQGKDFRIMTPPEAAICKECDLRSLCERDGTFGYAEEARTQTEAR
jgi:CRISPR/Cas system-associated exonuclease Cas4 (RecB family)